ncbi:MAG: hypothetical protein R2849_10145 [Thermomicrobiales bacterium]
MVSLAGAWGLWNLRRWGAILTFVVTLLNTLTAVPGLIEQPSGADRQRHSHVSSARDCDVGANPHCPASRRAYHS